MKFKQLDIPSNYKGQLAASVHFLENIWHHLDHAIRVCNYNHITSDKNIHCDSFTWKHPLWLSINNFIKITHFNQLGFPFGCLFENLWIIQTWRGEEILAQFNYIIAQGSKLWDTSQENKPLQNPCRCSMTVCFGFC